MLEVLLLVVPFLIVPALLGHICHIKKDPRKSVWYYRRYLLTKEWVEQRYAMVLFLISSSALLIALVYSAIWSRIEPLTGMLLAVLTILTGLWHLYRYFGTAIDLIRQKTPWKTALGLAAVGIATISKILVDQMIADATHLPAKDLPGAQLILALYLTPTLWFTAFSFIMGLVAMLLAVPLQVYLFWDDYSNSKKKRQYDPLSGLVALVALIYVPVLSLTLTQKLISKKTYSVPTREAIVFAAFMLPPTYCGLPAMKGATVVPLEDDIGAIAIPDAKLGYRFERIKCKPAIKSAEEVTRSATEPEVDVVN